MVARKPEQAFPVYFFFEQCFDSLGHFGISAGAGAADQQLSFEAPDHCAISLCSQATLLYEISRRRGIEDTRLNEAKDFCQQASNFSYSAVLELCAPPSCPVVDTFCAGLLAQPFGNIVLSKTAPRRRKIKLCLTASSLDFRVAYAPASDEE